MLDPERFNRLKTMLSNNPVSGGFEQEKSPMDIFGGDNLPTQRPNYLQRVKDSYMRRGESVVSDVTRPAKLRDQGASPFKVAGAVAEAGLRTVGNVAGAAFDPIADALTPVLEPLISKITQIPGVQDKVQDISAWVQKHPDAAKDLGAAFNIATLGAGKVGEPIAKNIGAATARKAGSAVEGIGKGFKGAGEMAYGIVAPMEKPTAIAMQSYQAVRPTLIQRLRGVKQGMQKPITEAQTAAKFGLTGSEWGLGVKAKRAASELWDRELKVRLESSPNRTNMQQFLSEVRDDIIRDNADLTRRNTLLKALNSFSEDFRNVRTPISDAKLQAYKEGWAKFVPEKYYRNEPIAGALNEVRGLAAAKAREKLYNSLGPEARRAYIDYSNLKSLEDAGLRTIDKLRDKSFFKQAWEFFVDKAITPVFSIGGKVLYRTGEGFEFIGNKGLKRVGDILKDSDNLLDAGSNLTKDLPMGMSMKDVSKKVNPTMGEIEPQLTTKILQKLEGRTSVSRQFIEDLTNSGDVRQAERDLIRKVLDDYSDSSPLAAEARKYKSAEEFVKAQGEPVYRGINGSTKDGKFSNTFGPSDEGYYSKEGYFSISHDKNVAKSYGERVLEGRLSPTANIEEIGGEAGHIPTAKELKYWKEQGVDGVRFNNKDFEDETIIFNPRVIQTKSQLTDLWNKANKGDINVPEFANKVKTELLPLQRSKLSTGGQYESIALPDDLRGPVANYDEHIYESPIKTSAGGVHFGGGEKTPDNYFAHTRIEDLPSETMKLSEGVKNGGKMLRNPSGGSVMGKEGTTRRVIEIQSDLFQKGRLERESQILKKGDTTDWTVPELEKEVADMKAKGETGHYYGELQDALRRLKERTAETSKLEPYRNTWHERIIREEIKQAAKDGKTKLQFPTGETAMKIEGLGNAESFQLMDRPYSRTLTNDNMKVGSEVISGDVHNGQNTWIITDVLGDGKFKAVPKRIVDNHLKRESGTFKGKIEYFKNHLDNETFDISGKVDTSNPIYKFYEKDVQKFLSKFGGKRIKDAQGVSWIEVPITKEMGFNPVQAFGRASLGTLTTVGAGVAGAAAVPFIKNRLQNSR